MNDLKLGIVFDVKNGKFKSEVKENTQAIKQFGNSTVRTSAQTRQLSSSLDNTNSKLVATNKLTQTVTRSIGGLAAGFGVGYLLNEMSQTTRTFQVLKATLETATGSKVKAADAFERLQKFAASTPYSVEESIQAFIKLKNLGLDPTEAALNSYGNTASAMGKSLDQFIEAVADASVSEFERLKEFGIKAKNQGDTIAFTFRKNKTEVANNAAAIEKYLQKLGNNDFGGAMERQAATFDGAVSNMGDSWDQFILNISENGVGDAMEDMVRGAASSFNFLGQHIEEINTLFSVGLVVAAGHATNAIAIKTIATTKELIASRASAVAAKVQAQSEYNLALAYKSSAIGSVQNNLADKRLIVTRTALTEATRMASVANRALSGSMALLGGPAGLAVLATYGIYQFATSTSDADTKVQGLSRSIDVALGKHKELAAQALQTDVNERMTRLAQLQQKIADIHAKLAVGHNQKSGLFEQGIIADSIEEAKKLGAEITLLKNKLSSLSGKKDDSKNKPAAEQPIGTKTASDLAQVEASLFTKEESIKASYVRRQQIIDKALLGKIGQEAKYNQLSLGLVTQQEAQLNALAQQKAAAAQKLIDDKVQADINARALVDQVKRDGWDLELANLQGYHSLVEAEEAAHNERVMSMKTRKTGDMQGTLLQFANFEKKTQLEKTSAVIGIGEFGFKAMAGQSKKAFAMYKAFSIGQALIKTYEAATGAYSAMASIPYIGPALGVAAAAAAVASGMAQVKQIKAQKPAGFERGGYIGDNNVIEFGERNKPEVLEFAGRNYLLGGNQGSVFNQSQLTEINGGGGGDSIHISSPITIQGNADESVIAELIERNHEAVYNAYLMAKDDIGEVA